MTEAAEAPMSDRRTTYQITGRIHVLGRSYVVLRCIYDPGRPTLYQDREFDRAVLEGIVPLEVGQRVEIHVRQRPGEIIHEFKPL